MSYGLRIKGIILSVVALFAVAEAGAQWLVPLDKTPLYRRSFTARYDMIGEEPVREAALSSDRSHVGFVRDNNLFVKDIKAGIETQITHDGERNKIINGATDWVYEEEFAFTRAWAFSPDGRSIAYLRFDESRVPEYSMMRYDEKQYPEPYTFKYPKAGEENSVVTLHVYDIDSGLTRRVDTGEESDQYIPRIGWTPAGELFFYRVNRLQNHFEVVLGDGRVIYDETSPTYIEHPGTSTVKFLDDGDRFVVRQETRTGWMHLYLYSISKGFLNTITSGEWEVTMLTDVEDDRVRYMSTEASPLEKHLYSVRLDGTDKKLETMQAPADDAREFFTIPIEGGIELNAWMMKPEGFDPMKEYPVMMTQYNGPGSQSVSRAPLGMSDMLLYRVFTHAGIIVVCVDGRGTGFRGEEFKKITYGQLGRIETEDQIAVARWLGSQPYVDSWRIGIYGWSYGGYIALNSILKGADVFKLAVAVAPVTSWRFYDTIYTEMYNGLPQDNPAGYDENSPLNYANLLRGKLLLVHGTGDDNVHVQHTFEMAKALVKARRQFDMMIYPDDNHGMAPSGSDHVRQKIIDYIIKNL